MSPSMLLLVLLCFSSADCPQTATLSSETYDGLYSPNFAEYHYWNGAWYILPKSDDDSLAVIRLNPSGQLETLLAPIRRFQQKALESAAISPTGKLWLKPLLNPMYYTLDLTAKNPSIQPGVQPKYASGDFVFIGPDLALGANSSNAFLLFGSQAEDHTWPLAAMQPDFHEHPVVGRANFHNIVPAWNGRQLAVGYNMATQFAIYDDVPKSPRFQTVAIRFPHYQPPSQTWPDGLFEERQRLLDFMNQFRRLDSLAWRDGVLYGKFRKGFSTQSLWAALYPKEAHGYVYDNEAQDLDLLAIHEDAILLGYLQETAEGEVTRCFIIADDLP